VFLLEFVALCLVGVFLAVFVFLVDCCQFVDFCSVSSGLVYFVDFVIFLLVFVVGHLFV